MAVNKCISLNKSEADANSALHVRRSCNIDWRESSRHCRAVSMMSNIS